MSEEEVRGALFRGSYWLRVLELSALLGEADRKQAERMAPPQYPRSPDKVRAAVLSLDQADAIAKRYALLAVRQELDWYHPEVTDSLGTMDRELHRQITEGIWLLDAVGIRAVQSALLARDEAGLRDLRRRLEAGAGELRASLDMGLATSTNQFALHEWRIIDDEFDPCCNSIDLILTAGEV